MKIIRQGICFLPFLICSTWSQCISQLWKVCEDSSLVYLCMISNDIFIVYHLFFTNKTLRFTDWLFSIVLIFSNVIILFSTHSEFFIYKLLLLVILLLSAIRPFLKFKNYALNHTIWHLIASLITRVVLM